MQFHFLCLQLLFEYSIDSIIVLSLDFFKYSAVVIFNSNEIQHDLFLLGPVFTEPKFMHITCMHAFTWSPNLEDAIVFNLIMRIYLNIRMSKVITFEACRYA